MVCQARQIQSLPSESEFWLGRQTRHSEGIDMLCGIRRMSRSWWKDVGGTGLLG